MRLEQSLLLFKYIGWNILPIICYDLRFPVFCRSNDDYDLLICVANWPAARIQAILVLTWKSQLFSHSLGLECIDSTSVVKVTKLF